MPSDHRQTAPWQVYSDWPVDARGHVEIGPSHPQTHAPNPQTHVPNAQTHAEKRNSRTATRPTQAKSSGRRLAALGRAGGGAVGRWRRAWGWGYRVFHDRHGLHARCTRRSRCQRACWWGRRVNAIHRRQPRPLDVMAVATAHSRRAGLRPLLRRALPTQAVAAVVPPMTPAPAQKQAGPVALAGAESCGLNKDTP